MQTARRPDAPKGPSLRERREWHSNSSKKRGRYNPDDPQWKDNPSSFYGNEHESEYITVIGQMDELNKPRFRDDDSLDTWHKSPPPKTGSRGKEWTLKDNKLWIQERVVSYILMILDNQYCRYP